MVSRAAKRAKTSASMSVLTLQALARELFLRPPELPKIVQQVARQTHLRLLVARAAVRCAAVRPRREDRPALPRKAPAVARLSGATIPIRDAAADRVCGELRLQSKAKSGKIA